MDFSFESLWKEYPVICTGVTSSITGIIAYFSSIYRSGIDLKRAISQEKEKLHLQFAEKMYEKRFEAYTPLIEITQELGKSVDSVKVHRDALERLTQWQTKSGGFLLLSEGALGNLYRLKDALRRNPGNGKTYTDEQREKIYILRNALRGSLRDDLDLYHIGEQKAK